jgi:hypothetical protein
MMQGSLHGNPQDIRSAVKQVAKMYTDISNSVAKSKKKFWSDGEMLAGERLKPSKGSKKDGMFRNVSGPNLRKTGCCG